MNQYEDLINKETQIISVADARYVTRPESTNQYVTALPIRRNNEELAYACNKSPGLPSTDIFKSMSLEEQKRVLEQLEKSRIYLPYYKRIEDSIDRALTKSYECRTSILKNRPGESYTYQDREIESYQQSRIINLGNAPTGFAIIGESGSGKSNGVDNVINKYPRLIIHNKGTMHQHIQIPILRVEMPRNSNFHGLYTAIGKALDEILGNTKVYEKELSRRGYNDTLDKKFFTFCNIIEVFNIGLLIIDEIEHISKKRVSEGTLETFLSLSNQTGIAVGVIGTQESFSKLFYEPRVSRRLGELINADYYCSNIKSTRNAIENFYAYLPLPFEIPLTDACLDVYQQETDGIIYYISQLCSYVAIAACTMAANGLKPNITPNLIKAIAKQELANKKIYEQHFRKNQIIEDQEYANETLRFILGNNSESNQETEENNQITMIPEKTQQNIMDIVKAAIHALQSNKFTDKQIESALLYITKKNPGLNLTETIATTNAELCKRKEEKENKKKRKQQEKENLCNLEEIIKDLPVSGIKGINTEQETHHA